MEDLRQFMFAPLNENKKWEPSSESEDIELLLSNETILIHLIVN